MSPLCTVCNGVAKPVSFHLLHHCFLEVSKVSGPGEIEKVPPVQEPEEHEEGAAQNHQQLTGHSLPSSAFSRMCR